MSEPTVKTDAWHMKRADEDTVYGPVDQKTLVEWAKSAQISPRDSISNDQETWLPSYELAFLNMVWIVTLPEPKDTFYGPTTIGALREFLSRGVVTHNSMVTHYHTHQVLPLGALLAAEEMDNKRASRPETKGQTGMIMMDMAKDQRIRQLTEDLRELRAEHEALKQKFRQLQMQNSDRR